MIATAISGQAGLDRVQVLIVEDDPDAAASMKAWLDRDDGRVALVETRAEMHTVLERGTIELILLDVEPRGADGWIEMCAGIPALVLADAADAADFSIGEMEAQLVGPNDLRGLLARLHTLRRRAERSPVHEVSGVGTDGAARGWVLDMARQRVKTEGGEVVQLTRSEYLILTLLACNPGRPVARDQLAAATSGRKWTPLDRAIDVHISNLRRKLDGDDPVAPSLIRTVRGMGYMFVPGRRV